MSSQVVMPGCTVTPGWFVLKIQLLKLFTILHQFLYSGPSISALEINFPLNTLMHIAITDPQFSSVEIAQLRCITYDTITRRKIRSIVTLDVTCENNYSQSEFLWVVLVPWSAGLNCWSASVFYH